MRKLALIAVIASVLSINSFAASNGKELFVQKCSACHTLSFPKNKADMVAPPAPGVMYHMHQRFDSDEKIVVYMKNFVFNPTTKTSLKKETKRFGLMPSQKGNVTPEELSVIINWMVKNVHMNKEEHERTEKRYKKQ